MSHNIEATRDALKSFSRDFRSTLLEQGIDLEGSTAQKNMEKVFNSDVKEIKKSIRYQDADAFVFVGTTQHPNGKNLIQIYTQNKRLLDRTVSFYTNDSKRLSLMTDSILKVEDVFDRKLNIFVSHFFTVISKIFEALEITWKSKDRGYIAYAVDQDFIREEWKKIAQYFHEHKETFGLASTVEFRVDEPWIVSAVLYFTKENSEVTCLPYLELVQVVKRSREAGKELFNQRNYKAALDKYTEAINQCESFSRLTAELETKDAMYDGLFSLYRNRAVCNFYLRQFPQCFQDAREAMLIRDDSKAFGWAAKVLLHRNELDAAEHFIRKLPEDEYPALIQSYKEAKEKKEKKSQNRK
jgi:tetratricopeptide (TPR) repeat protein